jgi:hypothetical protein
MRYMMAAKKGDPKIDDEARLLTKELGKVKSRFCMNLEHKTAKDLLRALRYAAAEVEFQMHTVTKKTMNHK